MEPVPPTRTAWPTGAPAVPAVVAEVLHLPAARPATVTDSAALHPSTVPVELPAGSLVVLAGLPGAGKTTLLRRLAGSPGVHALDAEGSAPERRRARVGR